MVSHAIVQKIILYLYKLTLSTERRFLSVIIDYFIRFNFQLYSIYELVLYALRNQRTIVRKGPDNPGAGFAGACTFQDKHIGHKMHKVS